MNQELISDLICCSRHAALLVALLLAGCAQSFSHPSKSDDEFKRDSYECEREAIGIRDGDQWRRMTRMCMELRGWKKEGL